jgi:hypothetical protein
MMPRARLERQARFCDTRLFHTSLDTLPWKVDRVSECLLMSPRFRLMTSLDAGVISRNVLPTDSLMHSVEMRCACVIHIKVASVPAECMWSKHSAFIVPAAACDTED